LIYNIRTALFVQDRHCTYIVTLSSFRATTVTVKKALSVTYTESVF